MTTAASEASASPLLRACFCLADGHGAALMRDASCLFWCAPGFDGPLRLARILDPSRGGSVGLRPAGSRGRPRGGWVGESGVVRWTWPGGTSVSCGLLAGAGGAALCWLAEGRPGSDLELTLQSPAAAGAWKLDRAGAGIGPGGPPDGPVGPLVLVSTEPIQLDTGVPRLRVPAGGLAIWLGLAEEPLPELLARARLGGESAAAAARRLLEAEAAEAETWVAALRRGPAMAGLERAPGWARSSLIRSLLTLRGLQDRKSGLLVASPLTSIPQGPGPQRAWDYRYAWLRDCADAGLALNRAGASAEAVRLATALAARVSPPDPAPVARLGGDGLPPEHLLPYLSGYRGALVRVGNGAAGQTQLDTIGEVVRLADSMERSGRCPDALLEIVPALADRAARLWDLPDHGLWEVRGAPRHYLHSKLLAATALEAAVRMSRQGRVRGDLDTWSRAEAGVGRLLAAAAAGHSGALTIDPEDPAADSSTLAGYLTGYLDGPATLDLVTSQLGEWPLLARHRPERDAIAETCAPFLFPALWAVVAESRLGRRAKATTRLKAILALAGPAGQLSEVADPGSRTLLGNYPQVQSHAAAVEAILELWGRPG